MRIFTRLGQVRFGLHVEAMEVVVGRNADGRPLDSRYSRRTGRRIETPLARNNVVNHVYAVPGSLTKNAAGVRLNPEST
jgi:hypothetical protein